MNDGWELIGKVLNLSTGLIFLGGGWCFKAEETPVGAEYLIMEKMAGVQINEVWREMATSRPSSLSTPKIRLKSSVLSTGTMSALRNY
ncbi:hypothetical protein BDV06DRAFT_205774 [Aspergillus oleicola]